MRSCSCRRSQNTSNGLKVMAGISCSYGAWQCGVGQPAWTAALEAPVRNTEQRGRAGIIIARAHACLSLHGHSTPRSTCANCSPHTTKRKNPRHVHPHDRQQNRNPESQPANKIRTPTPCRLPCAALAQGARVYPVPSRTPQAHPHHH